MGFRRRGASIGRVEGRGSVQTIHHRRCGAALVLFAALVANNVFTSSTLAQGGDSDATSSRAAREEAMRAIPWQRMAPNDRQLAQSIVNGAAIYRRLPTRVIDCHPAMFTFLIQHPEVIADVWRVMGVSRVTLDKLGEGAFRGNDGAGTTGVVRFLASEWGPEARNTAVVLADGAFEGKPFMMPLKARSIVLMRSSAVRERNGRYYVTVHADAFIHVDQMAVELVARTVQPWVNATADRNLIETLTFVSNFSRTAEKNPDGMKRMAARLTMVDEPTRTELMQLCGQTAQRYGQVEPNRAGGTMTVAQRGRVWP